MLKIETFFEETSATFTHIVIDPETNEAVIIDSVFGYDQYSGRTNTIFADQLLEFVKAQQLEVIWILDTHIHADHITAAHYLKEKLNAKVAIGSNITKVIALWAPIFDDNVPLDGSQFDKLLEDNDTLVFGRKTIKVMHTPGHTPACVSYLIEDAVFVGDTIFQPDVGTARTDFPGGSAEDMFASITKILSLPDNTRIFACHDYPPTARPVCFLSTVAEQKQHNVMLGTDKANYVKARNERDHGKPVPQMLLPSIQNNLRAGAMHEFVKIPVDKI